MNLSSLSNRTKLSKSGTITAKSKSRVRVGIRCRPPFQDEIDFAKGEFVSIIDTKKELPEHSVLGSVALTMMSGKQREFHFDYVFGPEATQDDLYDRMAKHVVEDVLRGYNGTIFAYGQTGTGKTYTMGILEFIGDEHAGIIPRAISQIFAFAKSQDTVDISITLSFLQLYRETIQDLLAPATNSGAEDNLVIREDPETGFYVVGLQEFSIRTYREAEALINLGLENRAIAPTLMNSTSSRSHTVLTLNVEQRITGEGAGNVNRSKGGNGTYSKTLRSKLLMVDLAGSERVRRTVSKGARLSEAKSINTSLSALGNVIAALAEQTSTHIPYRDSKLTRLLQDSLGGTASTALIATVGPAPVNYGETLSTLLFASRCMAVKSTPVKHEEIDYAEMCATLQAKVNAMEGLMTERLLAQQEEYDRAIRDLSGQLEFERAAAVQQEFQSTLNHNRSNGQANINSDELGILLRHLEELRAGSVDNSSNWLGNIIAENNKRKGSQAPATPDSRLIALLGYSYELIDTMAGALASVIEANAERDSTQQMELMQTFADEAANEKLRDKEQSRMANADPLQKRNNSGGSTTSDKTGFKLGSHLAPLSRLEALTRVEGQYGSNNEPVSGQDRAKLVAVKPQVKGKIEDYSNVDELAAAFTSIGSAVHDNIDCLNTALARKDYHYSKVKTELTAQLVEKRKREEEVVNWSYILKYLLASSSKLRKQLLRERKLQAQQAESNPSTLATIFNNNAITTGDRPKETDRRRSAKEDYQGFSIDINSASNNPLNISSDDIQTPVSSIAYTDAGMFGNNVNTNFVPVRSHFPANEVGEDNWGARSVDESDLSMSTTNRSYSNNQYGGNSNSRYGVPIQRSTISTIRSLPPKPVAKQRSANSSINTKTTRLPPSSFARDVVQELGVEDEQAEVAMSVVDKISAMTAEQIDKLDYETRQQILQIRKDLGLTSKDNGDAPVPSGRRRSSNSRSASAPRMRPNSQGNSTENSGRLGMVNNEFTAVSAQGKFGNSKSTVASRSNTYNKNNGGVKHEYVDLQFSPNSNTSTLNSSKFDNSYIKIDVDSDDDVGYSQLDDMDF